MTATWIVATDNNEANIYLYQGPLQPLEPLMDDKLPQPFTREIGAFLNRNVTAFERLLLVAPQRYLNEIRQQLTTPVAEKISGELDKALTNLSTRELPQHLQDLLNSGVQDAQLKDIEENPETDAGFVAELLRQRDA